MVPGCGPHVRAMRIVVPVNILGLPACAVPAGRDHCVPGRAAYRQPAAREDLPLEATQAVEDRAPNLMPIRLRVGCGCKGRVIPRPSRE